MIAKQLVDLLNSGDAVAIVGSGISADAGLPSWPRLFSDIATALGQAGHDTAKARAAADKNYQTRSICSPA